MEADKLKVKNYEFSNDINIKNDIIKINDHDRYVMTMNHSCCTGGGQDYVFIKINNGSYYESYKNYCGSECLFTKIGNPQDALEFEKVLLNEGFKKVK